jgi:polysaccharide export outer membrane protein
MNGRHRALDSSGIGRRAVVLFSCLLLGFSAAAAQLPVLESLPETSEDLNQRLQELAQEAETTSSTSTRAYRIGPEDLLEITVYEAPDLDRSVRVSEDGMISLPLLGSFQAAGLTPAELESAIQDLLRRNEIMKDPQVGVLVRELQSRPVSVFGAVKRPGVFQIRRPRSLLEILSLAEGLAPDAGNSVIVMRAKNLPRTVAPASLNEDTLDSKLPDESLAIDIRALLESGDPESNVTIYPGDAVKVARAGVVYVVGQVNRPGGFVLANNKNISLLQALALAEGFTRVAKKSKGVIIRTAEDGSRSEIPVDLVKMLKGQAPDPYLQADDIVFVPGSGAKAAVLRTADALTRVVGGIGITVYRPPAR